MTTGSLSVLNTGMGDIEIVFNQHDEVERERAMTMLTDMLTRGYAILMRLDDGTYVRVTEIDATRGRYIVQLPAADVAQAGPEADVEPAPTLKRRRGRPPTVRVSAPIETRHATGVARSAGG